MGNIQATFSIGTTDNRYLLLIVYTAFHCSVFFVSLLHFVTLCLSISELNKNPVEGFSAGLIDDVDIYKWEVVIIGPQDTLL